MEKKGRSVQWPESISWHEDIVFRADGLSNDPVSVSGICMFREESCLHFPESRIYNKRELEASSANHIN